MLKLLKLTLYSDVIACLVMFLTYLLFVDRGAYAIVVLIYTFGNILIPTFFGAVVFKLIQKKTTLPNTAWTVIIQILILAILFMACIYTWAAAEAWLFKEVLTSQSIREVFDSEFLGFLPAIVSTAIFLPIIDLKVNRPEHNI